MSSVSNRSPPGAGAAAIAAEPYLAANLMRLLDYVDELPFGATGALSLGERGVILVQAKRICWATASTMRQRLTDLLREQRTPPVPRASIEAVYQACRETRRPLGEALVSSGLVSESGLRAALLEHTRAALVELARGKALPASFLPHSSKGYEARYSFSTSELFAAFGSFCLPETAAAAQATVDTPAVPESFTAAFVRHPGCRGTLLLAVDPKCDLPAGGLIEACSWATGLLDIARAVDPTTSVARALWCSRTALVAWQEAEIGYLGVCASRAATARLLDWVERRVGWKGALPGKASRGAGA